MLVKSRQPIPTIADVLARVVVRPGAIKQPIPVLSQGGEKVDAAALQPSPNNGQQKQGAPRPAASVGHAGSSPAPDTVDAWFDELRAALDKPVTAHLSAADSRLGAIQLRTLIAMPGDVAALLLRLAEALEGART